MEENWNRNINKCLKKIVYVLLVLISSIIATMTLSMNIFQKEVVFSFNESNSIVWMILLAIFIFIYAQTFKCKNNRLIGCSLFLSIILSLLKIIGFNIDTYHNLTTLLTSKVVAIQASFAFVGWVIIFYGILLKIFSLFDKLHIKSNFSNSKGSIKYLIAVWVIIFIIYLPYFLMYYPGNASSDSIDQINQTLGTNQLTNHHPVLHTLFIGFFIKIGKLISDYSLGVALYSIFQLICLSGCFSYSLYYMKKHNVNIYLRILSFIYYAFYPVHALYGITMWKDIPFAICMLLLTIQITEFITNADKFFLLKRKLIYFSLIALLVMLFRNNGIYVVLIKFIEILATYRKHLKKVLIMFTIPIFIYLLIHGPIFSLFNISKSSVVEALSVPLQQFARITRDRGADLTEEEKDTIHRFIPVENIEILYNEKLSDPIKWSADATYISNNKMELIKTYIHLFIRFPIESVEAILCNSYGYWYPEASNSVAIRTIYKFEETSKQYLDLEQKPIIESNVLEKVSNCVEKRNIPIISMIFSIGFVFWLIMTAIVYCIYKRNYSLIITYIPVLVLWLTNLASPVFCEFRYIYSMFTCLPVLLILMFVEERNEEKNG